MSTTQTAVTKLCYAMRDALEFNLKTNIPASDPARVTTVVVGKYVGSPKGIILSVYNHHPLGFTVDRLNASAEEKSSRAERYRPTSFPTESLGGTRFRHILGTVMMRCVLENTTQEEALAIVELAKTRVANVINNDTSLMPLSDEFDYHIFQLSATEDYGYSGGGEDIGTGVYWLDWLATLNFRRTRM